MDTEGNLLKVKVHEANIQDRDGGKLLIEAVPREDLPRMKKLWADEGYRGTFVEWVAEQTGWEVEQTFAWLGRFRRLSKDYEQRQDSEESWIYLAMGVHYLNRIPTGSARNAA